MTKHFVDMNSDSPTKIVKLIQLSEQFKAGFKVNVKRPVYAANLFFENSTRTHASFYMAEQRLGMTVLDLNMATSSTQKGESLEDTVKTLQALGTDIEVIRHSQNGWYEAMVADKSFTTSLVNGGDGSGQHPSQCLLDLMTIYEEFSYFKGLSIGIIGDLAHSRVAKSDAQLLHKLGANVYFSGPKEWYDESFTPYGQYVENIDELIEKLDVVMLLRVQLERLNTNSVKQFKALDYHTQFGLTKARLKKAKQQAIIMHPAPVNRGVEIDSDLVESPQSRIFKQMANGVFARMAILASLLDEKGLLQEDLNID
ncbi:aspartate carbamoyltransferase catalytic subunit [Holzapfeliella floricola]|uniref:Aspartate carbamoyltransferase n=1 Tax=Holzapfeliella floricola DSM 23037 = JCM 16512 TaxID=1423744 RepID=A0A0R2DIW1_9LACO|nr:aspartate carbamoyltransferase catalytic subunit [Holzapfeliella floricola]KRN04014.1 aspartate carbamoyltransferase catalytic subunit [Holzapfeliella floricola DSM 23037 = JCM 16512]